MQEQLLVNAFISLNAKKLHLLRCGMYKVLCIKSRKFRTLMTLSEFISPFDSASLTFVSSFLKTS